jgi:Rrf2 family protein
MFKLGRKTEYALISILHMAENPDDGPVSKREIADAYAVPNELLGKVLQSLKKAGLVTSTQGVHGGYRLVKDLDVLTLGDVIQAIEGPLAQPGCTCVTSDCERQDVCNIRTMMDRFYHELHDFVYTMTVGKFRYGFQPETLSLTCNPK